ncbi:MAG: hypothetical protein RIS64_1645 [Bacteroidota bacterium]
MIIKALHGSLGNSLGKNQRFFPVKFVKSRDKAYVTYIPICLQLRFLHLIKIARLDNTYFFQINMFFQYFIHRINGQCTDSRF